MQPINDWGEALLASAAAALALFFAAIPKILGFLVILIVGWLISSLVERAVDAGQRQVGGGTALRPAPGASYKRDRG
ncbi:MAG TPA: hypothetical protein VNL77_14015 [Roseiflexaceae bacterium]|nr:hypothetical protein [Roseiflexaceae bacterium]